MFNRKKAQGYLILGLMLLLSVLGCKKRETMQNDTEAQTLIDNALVEQEFTSLIPLALQGLALAQNNSPAYLYCDSIQLISGDTADFSPNPIYRIKLSEKECSLFFLDSKKRSGELQIRTTGHISEIGTFICVKPNDLKADGLSYTCDSLLLRIQAKNDSNLQVYTHLINGLCSGSGFLIHYSNTKQLSLKPDTTRPGLFAYSVTLSSGEASGTNRFGSSFQSVSLSSEPLMMNTNCRFFNKGTEELTTNASTNMKINYGNGNCDETASYNIFENTVEFKLK